MPPLTDDDVDPVPSLIYDVVDPVPPLEGEATTYVKPNTFGGGPIDLSLLPLYPNYTTRHIWYGEVSLVGFFIYFYINFNF